MIIGGPVGVQQIVDLARAFDAGKRFDPTQDLTDDERGFSIHRLQHLSPLNAKRAVDEFFGNATGTAGATGGEPQPVTTVVEERSNTITVIGSPSLRRRAIAFLKEIDRPGAGQNSRIIRIYNAKNQVASALATRVADILGQGLQQNQGFTGNQQNNFNNNNLNNRGFGGTQDSRPVSGLTTLVIEGPNGLIDDNGRSFDVRITADDDSNTLAIVAPEEPFPLIMELLRQLDRLPNLTSEVKVFQVFNGDANEILDTLQSIFGATAGGNQQVQQNNQTGLQLPLQTPASDGASLLGLRFAVSNRLNAIVASGSISDLEFVEAMNQSSWMSRMFEHVKLVSIVSATHLRSILLNELQPITTHCRTSIRTILPSLEEMLLAHSPWPGETSLSSTKRSVTR